MSTFRAPIVQIRALEGIPKADRIELAVTQGYRSVVKKGDFQIGDRAAYIPEAAIVPEWLIRRLGLWNDALNMGKLAGAEGNRVTALTMRGCLSQGILLGLEIRGSNTDAAIGYLREGEFCVLDQGSPSHGWDPTGLNVADLLGLVKYEPEIPEELLNACCAAFDEVIRYDIEDLKAYPEILEPGEFVVATEKLHGTCTIIGVLPGLERPDFFFGGDAYVTSKGLAKRGLAFKPGAPGAVVDETGEPVKDSECTVYVRILRRMEHVVARMRSYSADVYAGLPLHLVGETFGRGSGQHLHYGLDDIDLRAFDAYVGTRTDGRFMDYEEKVAFFRAIGVPMVDVIGGGPIPYDRAVIAQMREGTTVTGGGAHIREGVVVTPVKERYSDAIGRVILKDVSEAYLGDDKRTDLT